MKLISLISFSLLTAGIITLSPLVVAQTAISSLRDTRTITISGQVKSVVGNDFILADHTGQVIVDAGPRWWQEINVSVGEYLTVVGEYDEGEFDAFSITRPNGQVMQIRPQFGPPPWAVKKD
ncbi:MAG: NirD/YgiW/YdeI family stress tolerance protein [Microcystis aeruginosa Ma_SC_T_19800800_S464]|jgi:uncharacterized protein YdeI (BOF family)|uniref:NirD/YgiW/YdeI family stress tolerance protein n=1 Tax=Microcystis aeruginosa Ma_SC_T_19800800_S464 TaxID=2486257 RepID=A0A552E5A9_MICAE|nr:MAG: NirD/YgiW/YdeI family stress tolerance protein [Microcystis aeruginosa Ma_SC_T_19800800_S464]